MNESHQGLTRTAATDLVKPASPVKIAAYARWAHRGEGGIVAGESARDVAAKRREKAQRLNKVADAYERGAAGEERTAHALAMLPASGWFVLHDVRWPGKRFANIDHVVVGPGGVFVIDSKAWSGRVEVRDGVLRQNGYKRESTVSAAAEAAMAVAGQVPGLNPYAVKPVLCFVGEHHLEGWARDVMLCTPQNLVAMLLSRPTVMDAATVRLTLMHLQTSMAAAISAASAAWAWPNRPARVSKAKPRATSRRRSRAGTRISKMFRGLALMIVGIIALGAFVNHADEFARTITPKIPAATPDPHHQTKRLGVAQALPAATGRPSLRVTASRARTVHRVGTLPYLYEGNRFFGVRLTVVNRGKHVWVSQPGTTYDVTGESISPRRGGSGIRIREGRVLPDPIRLAPGHRVTGYVVFQVPTSEPITSVSMTVGPGKPSTVGWHIDRQ